MERGERVKTIISTTHPVLIYLFRRLHHCSIIMEYKPFMQFKYSSSEIKKRKSLK